MSFEMAATTCWLEIVPTSHLVYPLVCLCFVVVVLIVRSRWVCVCVGGGGGVGAGVVGTTEYAASLPLVSFAQLGTDWRTMQRKEVEPRGMIS